MIINKQEIKIRKAVETDSEKVWVLMKDLAVFEKYIDAFAITPEIVRESGFRKNPPDFHCIAKIKTLEQMIRFYEKDYLQQWDSLPGKFKKGMMVGAVAFELEVTDLQGQKKLSRNKTETERQRTINHLEKSETPLNRILQTI